MHAKVEIETSNIPIINLRKEFEEYLRLFKTDDFKERVVNCHIRPVDIPSMTWHGLPHYLLTLMLQRSILGLESYLSAAVAYELAKREALSPIIQEKLENPFSLSRKTVVAFYERMPELIDGAFKLSVHSQGLYDAVADFYRTTRNPIFHGSLVALSGENFDRVASAFDLLAAVYDWIDRWYSAFPSG